ncbi:MAG: acyl-CoA dehydrogenase family protein [Dehalococcoidia bacterium]|nr:acyl-CoA dehydrogenase family protein [Dehalococcoidia bacterium]
MDFLPSRDEEAFREEVRHFFENEFSAEFLENLENEPPEERTLYRECVNRLARRGWLGIGWPREYGGMERPLTEQLIYYVEMYRRLPSKVINPVGVATALAAPVIMKFGSEELKKEYLPRIRNGEATFCLGYSEPKAGSDLVGLLTHAIVDGDYYVINGQKMFTTAAEYADFCWLSARTDPTATKRSQGISLFMVPMRSPGIEIHAVPTMSRFRVNTVSFRDVRVHKKHLIGEENQGWKYITQALSHERIGFGVSTAILKHLFSELIEYAKAEGRGGLNDKERPARSRLAQQAIELEVSRLLAARLIWMLEKGLMPYQEASMAKIFVTELEQRLANTGMQVLGLYGQLKKDSFWARLDGKMEDAYRHSIMGPIGGGSNEVQRMIIAIAGLGLPRA